MPEVNDVVIYLGTLCRVLRYVDRSNYRKYPEYCLEPLEPFQMYGIKYDRGSVFTVEGTNFPQIKETPPNVPYRDTTGWLIGQTVFVFTSPDSRVGFTGDILGKEGGKYVVRSRVLTKEITGTYLGQDIYPYSWRSHTERHREIASLRIALEELRLQEVARKDVQTVTAADRIRRYDQHMLLRLLRVETEELGLSPSLEVCLKLLKRKDMPSAVKPEK